MRLFPRPGQLATVAGRRSLLASPFDLGTGRPAFTPIAAVAIVRLTPDPSRAQVTKR
jgi:hypothetical protein